MLKTQAPLWRQIQAKNFTSTQQLLDFLELVPAKQKHIFSSPRFVLNLPRRLAEKIEKNSLEDPILRQFVPLQEEQEEAPGFVSDPVQDQTFCTSKKLLQKYRGRALLLTTSACAMHCRFCFRQNFPYETKLTNFEKELEILRNDETLEEVILSGGDPLSISDQMLATLFEQLDEIKHIKRIRFHTRFPVGIPERIDASFLSILKKSEKQIVFVIHCNHPKELDTQIFQALKSVSMLGIPVLNQSVLLKGVNDEEGTMLELCQKLIDNGIIPYYLHLLDLVKGASHFLVSAERGEELVKYLQENLSGFGVPRLVREDPYQPSKTSITN